MSKPSMTKSKCFFCSLSHRHYQLLNVNVLPNLYPVLRVKVYKLFPSYQIISLITKRN